MVDLAAHFAVVGRQRPVRLVAPDPGLDELDGAVAPYVATRARRTGSGPAELGLTSGSTSLVARFEPDAVALRISVGRTTSHHRSRRHGRPIGEVEAVALALTGPQVTAFTRERGRWIARSRFDLTERDDAPDPHHPDWLAGLRASAAGPLAEVESGGFGQLGLRDLRVVTHADGTPYRPPDGPPGAVLLTATSAGPGWFPTGHASVWSLDPATLALEHRGDLFVRRGGRVFGDHAVHLLRDGANWLLAASTWGDFDPRRRPVSAVLAESDADLTRGVHVLGARPLALPTDGLRSVGVWDPHLVRDDDGWLVGFVSASRYFRFHPVVANGPSLDALRLRAADTARRECEGTTLLRTDQGWRVLASDKRTQRYPVLDLDLHELGSLDAAYPDNIPWPTLVDTAGGGTLLAGFDGRPCGGELTGYGTHGRVVIQHASTSISR